MIALGIDTGGTYTDAVVMNQDSGEVLASEKALTTHHDLSIGVGRAVAGVFEQASASRAGEPFAPADVALVGLSTTLATNAIVEGQGSPVCLLLIGYDPALIQCQGFERDLVTRDVVYVTGGHDGEGNEVAPLDEAAVVEAILVRRDQVAAFAVSAYFGVRNPAHELRVRALIEDSTAGWSGLEGSTAHVTCGHELTTRLNSVRRATTAALNAQLILLLRELVAAVQRTIQELGVTAPLMITKGDGSLVRAEWAMRRPIETILSGPAASLVGAWHLAGRRDAWVVDVGGTTTDVAALRDGLPRLNPEGAQVGLWRTMVEAADVRTVGLGGDSQVRWNGARPAALTGLTIGPRRVVPLCQLASSHPEVVIELSAQLVSGKHRRLAGQFLLTSVPKSARPSEAEWRLLVHLADGPKSFVSLAGGTPDGLLGLREMAPLEARKWVLRSGFTPTDALHVLGRFQRWDTEASRLGAELLAASANLSSTAFCEQVVSLMSNRVTTELVTKVLSDECVTPNWEREPVASTLLARAMGSFPHSDLTCRIELRHPLVAVGAPVEAYLPAVAHQLSTQLIIPKHAEVANALGAVAGGVTQRLTVLVRPLLGGERFRLHLPDGVRDFDTLEDAVACAEDVVRLKYGAWPTARALTKSRCE